MWKTIIQRLIMLWLFILLTLSALAMYSRGLHDNQQADQKVEETYQAIDENDQISDETIQTTDEDYERLYGALRPAGPPAPHIPYWINGNENREAVKKLNVDIPDVQLDFEALRRLSEDTVAWLYSPDTLINYPVMKTDDYEYYLYRLPDGSYDINGALFIDFNNAPDFSDKLTVIYGHNMRSGKMFGTISGYKKQKYFDEHPYMYLYTESGNYRVDLIYGFVIGVEQWQDRALMYETNLDELLDYAKNNTTFTSEAEYTGGDKVIALATCTYEFNNARYLLLGLLRPEYD